MSQVLICGIILLSRAALCASSETKPANSSLDRGYHDAYNLDFPSAQQEFAGWEREHPADPLGPVSEAAGVLFSELDRLGVLEAQFYQKDSSFLNRPKLTPDVAKRAQFDSALERADMKARQALAADPKNKDALFTMALVNGLHADYAALIEKRDMAGLSYTRDATTWANKLLTQAPDYYDAYLASGMSKYIIGSLVAPLRWLLHLAGYQGDKQEGMRQVELTAAHGHYLAPFARVLLAIAYLRKNDKSHARELLTGLRDEFPANPLFPKEIARIDGAQSAARR
ncbi:MAG TPA: hypothetical protein VGR50_09235 [Terriglobales bacterium]|nr:hypothetical protein [Terriglobales bacterium]